MPVIRQTGGDTFILGYFVCKGTTPVLMTDRLTIIGQAHNILDEVPSRTPWKHDGLAD